jgi:hypothetical protein
MALLSSKSSGLLLSQMSPLLLSLSSPNNRTETHLRFFFSKVKKKARCQWLMPVILGTQEAEIRRIGV